MGCGHWPSRRGDEGVVCRLSQGGFAQNLWCGQDVVFILYASAQMAQHQAIQKLQCGELNSVNGPVEIANSASPVGPSERMHHEMA